MKTAIMLALSAAMLSAAPALAADRRSEQPSPSVLPERPPLPASIGQPASTWATPEPTPARWPYFIVFGGVVLLGVLVFRLRDRAGPSVDDTPTIDVIATRALTAKTKIVLVETKGREMLLSVTDRSVELLSEWLDEEQPEQERLAPAAFTQPLRELPEIEPETEDDEPTSPFPTIAAPEPTRVVTQSTIESEAIRGLIELRKNAEQLKASNAPWTRLRRNPR